MAGYICKIVIEDTHPPVWRRVVIPDKITFYDLHQIIQVVFRWEEAHLHDFRIPSENIVIDDEAYVDPWRSHYYEMETCVDDLFENHKWIRYVYDFGDEWRHRINIEKYDPDYTKRQAKLLKYKGDNFEEDSGGIWGWNGENNRFPFEQEFVEEQLESMNFPEYEQEDIVQDDDPFEDIIEKYPAFSVLFMRLRELYMTEQQIIDCLVEVIEEIRNNETLDVIIENIKNSSGREWIFDTYAEVWSEVSELMIELENPMLEDKNRRQYAKQQKISKWSIGMLSEDMKFKNTKEQHLYEFPLQIQECMYDAERRERREDVDRLLVYKKENHICSEEFIYLLSTICINEGYYDDAKKLIEELSKSSVDGKNVANILKEEIKMYEEEIEDEWLYHIQKTEPKIGRNDPCPCGSGKKYKKCCGKNK